MNVHWPIIRNLLRRPFRTCIVDDRRSWRGIDLLVGAYHVAEQAVSTSERQNIGILLPTSGAMPMCALASWICGRTIVPLNFLLKPDELQYVVKDSEIDTIITAQPMLDFLDAEPRGPRIVRLEDLSFRGVPDFRWPAIPATDDLAAILYTSGTSGRPKGVMLSHGNIRSNIKQFVQWANLTDRQIFLGVLPAFHSFGLTVLCLTPITIGARLICLARFMPKKIIELLREHRPTAFIAIPSMYNAILSVKGATADDFASLEYIVSGGEPLPDAVAQAFRERFNVTINEGYGLTETSPVTNVCRPHEYRPHSVGMPISGVTERIVDPDSGAVLGVDEEGEIQIAGDNVMQGYFKLPDETAAVFTEDGFFRTGDFGKLDADGFLHITGRIKEMMIIGGENVFPREIEEVLNAHPDVRASAVVGVTDPMRGELPFAFVELEDSRDVDPQDLRSWCRDRLAGYKAPRDVRILDELPRNPTGKILRRDLRSMV
jgi:long-chain acyl-CoA synthetase